MTDFRTLGSEVSNWGRWGDDDRIGTINLITPERVAAAAALARTGRVFDLGLTLGANGPQAGVGRINPVHLMSITGDTKMPDGGGFADDYIFMPLQCATQWDGLSHVFYDDYCYNGVPTSTVTARGASELGIEHLARGIVGRGVVLDIARLRGVDHLVPGDSVGPEDLQAACDRQGVEVGPGDILLVRTGWIRVFKERSAAEYMGVNPGLTMECARWLREHDVAALACDNWSVEPYPSGVDAVLPLHYVAIRDMGMTLGEMFDLEALAEDCAADGVWECFLTAPVLKFANAVGCPLNPLAIK
jgi:kynurenine formamidase